MYYQSQYVFLCTAKILKSDQDSLATTHFTAMCARIFLTVFDAGLVTQFWVFSVRYLFNYKEMPFDLCALAPFGGCDFTVEHIEKERRTFCVLL